MPIPTLPALSMRMASEALVFDADTPKLNAPDGVELEETSFTALTKATLCAPIPDVSLVLKASSPNVVSEDVQLLFWVSLIVKVGVVPATSSSEAGELVPIPTFPLELMTMRFTELVKNSIVLGRLA